MLEALMILSEYEDSHAYDSLKKITNDWKILDHLDKILSNNINEYKASAWCIFLQYEFRPILRDSPRVSDHTIIRRINKVRGILNHPDQYQELLAYYVEIMNQYGNCEEFINNFRDFPLFIDHVLLLLSETEGSLSKIKQFSYKRSLASFYIKLLELDRFKDRGFQKIIKKNLKIYTRDELVEIIHNENDEYKFILAFKQRYKSLYLGINLLEALLEIAENVLEGKRKYAIDSSEKLDNILPLLKSANCFTLSEKIYETVKRKLQNDETINQDFFKIFGSLIELSVLLKDPILISIVFYKIVDTNYLEMLKWLVGILNEDDNLLTKYIDKYPNSKQNLITLSEKISSKIESTKISTQENLLNQLLNVLEREI